MIIVVRVNHVDDPEILYHLEALFKGEYWPIFTFVFFDLFIRIKADDHLPCWSCELPGEEEHLEMTCMKAIHASC